MKKLALVLVSAIIFLSSCEVEYRGDSHYYHPAGWHHRHYPGHHDVYNHGWHHDEHGGEIIVK